MRAPAKRMLGPAAMVFVATAFTSVVLALTYREQGDSMQTGFDSANQLQLRMMGLDRPAAHNLLDPRYRDEDGTLVAAPPVDSAAWLDPPRLTFSYLGTDDGVEFRPAFAELITALARATGKPVDYVAYASVTEQLRAVAAGRLSITALNTGAVPVGVCEAGFVPLVQAADATGNTRCRVLIITPAGSPLKSVEDLHGHELTLTEMTSNSGCRAPLVMLREHGLMPTEDYEVRYSLGQVASIQGIKARTFEAAAVAEDVLRREQNAGRIASSDYKVIFSSDQIFPGASIGCPYNLKPALVAEIRQALLAFDWKGTGLEKLFASEGKVKFVPVHYKKDFAYVRGIDDRIGYVYSLHDGLGIGTQPQRRSGPVLSMQ